MKLNRRNFLKTSLAAGTLASMPLVSCSTSSSTVSYEELDRVAEQPILKKALFDSPVIIKSLANQLVS